MAFLLGGHPVPCELAQFFVQQLQQIIGALASSGPALAVTAYGRLRASRRSGRRAASELMTRATGFWWTATALAQLAQGDISRGETRGERLRQRSLGVETIRTHLERIYDKLHVRSRTEAALKYREGRASA